MTPEFLSVSVTLIVSKRLLKFACLHNFHLYSVYIEAKQTRRIFKTWTFFIQGYTRHKIAWNEVLSHWEIQLLEDDTVSFGYYNDTAVFPIGRQIWYITNDVCDGKEVEFAEMTLKVSNT